MSQQQNHTHQVADTQKFAGDHQKLQKRRKKTLFVEADNELGKQ